MKIYIVIVPWDYNTADAIAFRDRKEAERYIAEGDIDDKARPYARVEEQDL